MLSVLIICQKIDENLIRSVQSIEALHPQILIGVSDTNISLGLRKNTLIRQSTHDWVLVLDSDEVVSVELLHEIKTILQINLTEVRGYRIPYQNYAFGGVLRYGGEKYAKIRLFRKKFGQISIVPIHEEIDVVGQISKLSNVIIHNSYRSTSQLLTKFTKYAWQVAGEKRKSHERVTLKKLFMYGPHMVWARAIKDQGWRDGWRGIVIALCFGYMETLTYWFLLWRNLIGS